MIYNTSMTGEELFRFVEFTAYRAAIEDWMEDKPESDRFELRRLLWNQE
jgi:hypothetical protein